MSFSITSILIIFTFVSVILVIIGSIKLITVNTISGSRLIFAAVVGSILTVFLPESEPEAGEASLILQGIETSVNSILIFMAAYGFLRLANHTVANSADKSLQPTQKNDASEL